MSELPAEAPLPATPEEWIAELRQLWGPEYIAACKAAKMKPAPCDCVCRACRGWHWVPK